MSKELRAKSKGPVEAAIYIVALIFAIPLIAVAQVPQVSGTAPATGDKYAIICRGVQ